MIPWAELRPTVEILQLIIASSMQAASDGDENAADFVGTTFALTAKRSEALAEGGVDVLDENQLFAYVSGFSHSIMVAHNVLHVYGFETEEVEPEDQCESFVYGAVANLLPLMQLLPLHLILEMED
jgi:hypothetical protein